MDKPSKLTVWGVGTARTMRVHWLLQELNLTYETHRIEPRTVNRRRILTHRITENQGHSSEIGAEGRSNHHADLQAADYPEYDDDERYSLG